MSAATLLFLPYPSASGTWGSVVKLAAIAEVCRARGHRVVFHAGPPVDALLVRRGFPVVGCPVAAPGNGDRPIDSFYDACAALGFDDELFWRDVLASEERAVATIRPDVLVSHLRLTAPLTAARHGLPLASCASWCTDPRGQARDDDPLDDMARALAGYAGDPRPRSAVELVSWHADAQLASSDPVFEPELADAPRAQYTGYLRDPAPPRRGHHGPVPERLVLAYTSSAAWGTDRIIRVLAESAARAGATLWCVTRAGGPTGRLGPQAELFGYLPFEQLIPAAGALVFHGGQGSALAALHHGTPALTIPGRHYERRYNSERLVALGAGVHGDLLDLRPSRLTEILSGLLDSPRPPPRPPDGGVRGAGSAADAVLALAR